MLQGLQVLWAQPLRAAERPGQSGEGWTHRLPVCSLGDCGWEKGAGEGQWSGGR